VGLLKVGDPTHEETDVGPLILPRETDRVASWIVEARAGGARVVLGDTRHSQTTLDPTILVAPPAGAKVSTDEIFGPVTCIYPYRELNDAIAIANSLPVAFQASIFAQDIGIALHAAERLDASAVMVNDTTAFRTDWMPFAGRRQSGYGTGGIPFTMRDMSEEKMIILRSTFS
jgi:acyl-CoA reductase-like NAD-dependent aldehyde dehydrogenase